MSTGAAVARAPAILPALKDALSPSGPLAGLVLTSKVSVLVLPSFQNRTASPRMVIGSGGHPVAIALLEGIVAECRKG